MRRPVLYWILWAGILAVLAYLGYGKVHVREFVMFIAILLGLAVVCVTVMAATYRKGESVTRDPFED